MSQHVEFVWVTPGSMYLYTFYKLYILFLILFFFQRVPYAAQIVKPLEENVCFLISY